MLKLHYRVGRLPRTAIGRRISVLTKSVGHVTYITCKLYAEVVERGEINPDVFIASLDFLRV
jgi:hypothetical protein